MNKDLTVGKPSQVLWQFCLPMFGSIIFQQLYNIADRQILIHSVILLYQITSIPLKNLDRVPV